MQLKSLGHILLGALITAVLQVGSRAGDMTLMFADRFPELSVGGQWWMKIASPSVMYEVIRAIPTP